jgi:flagellar biosynthesis protein FlhB
MAEGKDDDDFQRTEEPSQKKLDDARAKGDVPRSGEFKNVAVIAGGLAVLALLSGFIARSLQPLFLNYLGNAHAIAVDENGARFLGTQLTMTLLLVLSPVLAVMTIAALTGGLAQGMPTISWQKVTPGWSKISPMAGVKRLFGLMGWVELLKTVLKFAVVGAAVIYFVWPHAEDTVALAMSEPISTIHLVRAICIKLFFAVLVMVVVMALADYTWQRFSFMARMRMTKQEQKEENKEQDGDPVIKARIRALRMERARKRMMAAIPTADVIITNPTHYAVALKYEHGKMAAPKVVAKGVDHIAAKMRELAAEHKVPLVENPPLARALYATVDIGDAVQEEHYKAVAEVISYVMRLKGKLAPKPATPSLG